MSQLTGVGIVNFVNVLPTISEGNVSVFNFQFNYN